MTNHWVQDVPRDFNKKSDLSTLRKLPILKHFQMNQMGGHERNIKNPTSCWCPKFPGCCSARQESLSMDGAAYQHNISEEQQDCM